MPTLTVTPSIMKHVLRLTTCCLVSVACAACGPRALVAIGGADSGPATADLATTPSAPARCKRGMATVAAPQSAFAPTSTAPGVSWYYNWAADPATGADAALEFVPMVWGGASINDPLPAGSRYVLGFNEPNFKSKANLSASQAASDWPSIEAHAQPTGIPIVAPGVNYCGSATSNSGCNDPTVYDPYTYLKDFLADCNGCEVDYIAVHWYNCDLPSLKAYIEGNSSGLQGFLQFGKPIWVTEFSCDSTHSAADQKAYMQEAIPYLEGNPNIFRYSWFSSTAIATSVLANPDGTLTDLGATYVSLPQSCQ